MRTSRAKPSSLSSETVPVPSTWPWTTWPPSRSPARRGSSTFTASPSASGPREERLSVSAITSARKRSPSGSTAVRHTPFTAIESPWASSAASGVSTSSRTPSPSGSTRPTRAVVSTRPVNTRRLRRQAPGGARRGRPRCWAWRPFSPLRKARAHQHVAVDLLDARGDCPARLLHHLHALPVERPARTAAARQQGRHEDPRLVDLTSVHERAREVWPALEQHRQHLA